MIGPRLYLHAVDYVLHRHAHSLASASSLITALTTLEGRVLTRQKVRLLPRCTRAADHPNRQAPPPCLIHTDALANDDHTTLPHQQLLESFVARSRLVQGSTDPRARAAALDKLQRLQTAYTQDPSAQRHAPPTQPPTSTHSRVCTHRAHRRVRCHACTPWADDDQVPGAPTDRATRCAPPSSRAVIGARRCSAHAIHIAV